MKTPKILMAAVLTAIFGCGGENSGKGGGKNAGDAKGAVDLTTAKPDMTLSANEFHAEVKKDYKAAKAKYIGKIVEVTGKVSMLQPDMDAKATTVILDVDKDLFGLRCAVKDVAAWEKVWPGATVALRGQIAASEFAEGQFGYGQIVRVDGKPAASMTAVELSDRFLNGKKELQESLNEKWVYVDGDVVKAGENKEGGLEFTLKGKGTVEIACFVPIFARQQVLALQPGQKVKVLGKLGAYENVSLSMSIFGVK